MTISAKVIADSVNPNGERLTTFELLYPRFIHSELMTHRVLSRNAASSRAIPVKKMLSAVLRGPASPIHWGTNQPGMQARSELSGWRRRVAIKLFFLARYPALFMVWLMTKVGLHKQVANRLLEPWGHITVVCSATEWENFFKLRLHPDAQPEFQELARCIKVAMDESVPQQLPWSGWHLPYVEPEDYGTAGIMAPAQSSSPMGSCPPLALVSAARCARVSYVRQGERRDLLEDLKMAERLSTSGHWSPFEHPAMAAQMSAGNFEGFLQVRKTFEGEDGKKAKE
jgi:hypothetical protein